MHTFLTKYLTFIIIIIIIIISSSSSSSSILVVRIHAKSTPCKIVTFSYETWLVLSKFNFWNFSVFS